MSDKQHDDVELYAGDTWAIDGTLLDMDGGPLDITNIDLDWILRGENGAIAIIPDDVIIDKGDDPTLGLLVINVSASITTGLPAGRYSDTLRMRFAGKGETLWEGAILVQANRFGGISLRTNVNLTGAASSLSVDAVIA